MIRLSGKEPDVDVAIEFIGVRPGEKLHEELWGDGEQAVPTSHAKILRCATQRVDPAWLEEEIVELERIAAAGDAVGVVARLNEILAAPQRLDATAPQRV